MKYMRYALSCGEDENKSTKYIALYLLFVDSRIVMGLGI